MRRKESIWRGTQLLSLCLLAVAGAQAAEAPISAADLKLLQAHAPNCSAAQVQARLVTVTVSNGNVMSLAQARVAALRDLVCNTQRKLDGNQTSMVRSTTGANALQAALAAAPVVADLSTPTAALIQASGENAPYEGRVQLFDNNAASKWLTFQPTGWVSYNLGAGQRAKLSSYSLTSGNDEPMRDPLDWQVQGSNDGVNWATLDRRSGQLFGARLLRQEYAVAAAPSYQYFRLNVTRNNGASLLQLGEMELLGTPDVPVVNGTPQLVPGVAVTGLADVAGGTKQYRVDVAAGSVLNITLNGGQGDADLFVRYGQPASDSSYDCKSTGSGNNEACSINPTQAGSYYVQIKGYSAYSGATLSANLAQPVLSWEAVTSPKLAFVNDGSPGGLLFNQLVPDALSYVRAIAQGVARTLYHAPGEVPVFDTLELKIERWKDDPNGVAWKAGDPPRITVAVNAYYLERVAAEGRNVAEEVRGILFHEMTHAYQHSTGMALPAIEGMADTVRYLNGYIPLSERHVGGSWTDSYKTTAFFFVWIQQTKGFANFSYCANQLAKPGQATPWSWDRMTQVCAGNTLVAPLWQEYQAWLPANGG